MFYNQSQVRYMMEKCINCVNYSWDQGSHICSGNYHDLNIAKDKIFPNTFEMCTRYGGFIEFTENWWMIK